jgi:hypothetical protein
MKAELAQRRAARRLKKYGSTLTFAATTPTGSPITIKGLHIEAVSELPYKWRSNVVDLPERDVVQYILPVPQPADLPVGWTGTGLEYLDTFAKVQAEFQTMSGEYTVYRIIDLDIDDIVLYRLLVCDN